MKKNSRLTQPPGTVIQNCRFTGVEWDGKAIAAVQTVAQALLNLTELFKSQGVTMEAMIKIGETKEGREP